MTDESNVINFPIRAPGAPEASQAVGGFVAALKSAQAAFNEASKSAKTASDSIGGVNKTAKGTGDALAATAAQAKAAAKEKTALARAADDAAKSLKKERDAAAELVSSTLSPLSKEQEKLNKQIGQLTTELGRLREERAKALAGGFDQREKQIDLQIGNTQSAIAKLRSNRVGLSQNALAGPAAPGAAIGSTASEAERASASLDGMATASARGFAALNVLGGELVHINPEMATMVQAVGRSSGAMSGFAGIVGGPFALAIGAAVAGIGLWIDDTRRETEEQEKLAESIKKTNDAIDEQVKSARALVYKGSADPINAEINAKRAALADLQKTPLLDAQGKTVTDSKGNVLLGGKAIITPEKQRQIDDLNKGIAALEERKKQAEADEKEATERKKFWEQQQQAASLVGSPNAATQKAALAAKSYLATHNEDGSLIKTGDGTTAAGRAEYRRETATGTRLGEQDESLKRQLEAAKQYQEAQKKIYADGLAAQRDVEARKTDEAFKEQQKRIKLMRLGVLEEVEAHKDKESKIVSLAEFRLRKEAEHDQTRKQEVAEYSQLSVRGYQTIGAIGIQSLQALAKGQKITGKMILAAIGDAAVGEGTRTLFQGLAMSANPLTPGAGAGMIGIGTAEIAFGIGLGAATRGAAGAGSGGYGGGTHTDSAPGGSVYWDGQKFVRGSPYAPVPANNTQGGGGNIYVQQTYQSTFAPTRQDAEAMVRATREGLRTGSMNPNWAQGH